MAEQALDRLLIVPTCAACASEVSARRAFCLACAGTIERADPHAGAPYVYGGALAEAITRWKYRGAWQLSKPLAGLFAAWAVREHAAHFAMHAVAPVLLPIPLAPARLVSRGFNQAAALALSAGDALGLRVHTHFLQRIRTTAPQVGNDAAMRRQNLIGAFCTQGEVAGLRVILVDDVRTTGATLEEATRVLESAGASVVGAWTLASAEGPSNSARGQSGHRK